MSSPKFLVFKLKDLRIPALIILIGVALFIFLIFKNKTTPTFSPSTGYQDGKYIAGITLSDAEMDVIVEVMNHQITSVSLSGLDETSSILYSDLVSSVDYISTYVTATQSLELPANSNTSTATLLLMDAVKIALSDDESASVTNTYQKVELAPHDSMAMQTDDTQLAPPDSATLQSDSEENTQDIFVDEFQEEDFTSQESASENTDTAPAEVLSSTEQ